MGLETYCATHGCTLDAARKAAIFGQTRDAAYQIIERKGATHYAVAAGLLRIVEAFVRDQRTVLSVSSLIHDFLGIEDVYLSMPTVVSGRGAERMLRLPLDASEADSLRHSAKVIADVLDGVAMR
jgi:L-lactate dehydrogenase